MPSLIGQTTNPNEVGVLGESSQFEGVRGVSHADYHGGVVGINDDQSNSAGPGVYGVSKGTGVWGDSQTWMGVYGKSESTTGGAGVMGEAVGTGVIGTSKTWMGVYGKSESTTGGAGVMGEAVGPGVIGVSQTWHGAYGETQSTTGGAGVWGEHKGGGIGTVGISNSGIGVYGKGGQLAGRFEGNLEVTGDIRLANADCAEDFEVIEAGTVEPGTVMVLGEDGRLRASQKAYDKRVTGVVSGAGNYKPGVILDRQEANANRKPIALLGKVFCRVDAKYAPIEMGDLLTSSPTPGYAMKATDPYRAFGAVIGKALQPLSEGQALIPILVALQ